MKYIDSFIKKENFTNYKNYILARNTFVDCLVLASMYVLFLLGCTKPFVFITYGLIYFAYSSHSNWNDKKKIEDVIENNKKGVKNGCI